MLRAMQLEARGSLSTGDMLPAETCAGAGRRKRRQEGCPGFALMGGNTAPLSELGPQPLCPTYGLHVCP